MPFTDEAFDKALAAVKKRLADEGRTIWTRADGEEFTRLIAEFTDARPERRGAEDEIRYSENGMGGGIMERFCE